MVVVVVVVEAGMNGVVGRVAVVSAFVASFYHFLFYLFSVCVNNLHYSAIFPALQRHRWETPQIRNVFL